jgi:hypothetical protein
MPESNVGINVVSVRKAESTSYLMLPLGMLPVFS